LLEKIAQLSAETIQNGNKILIAGNGGSAADSQHIAAELVGRFKKERKGLAAIALTTDTSILTSVSNDYEFNQVFSRQVEALGNKGDLFIGISTSGNSKNIVQAINEAKEKQMINIGLTGATGGMLADLCDYCLKVPSKETSTIQESHIMVGHILCSLIENQIT